MVCVDKVQVYLLHIKLKKMFENDFFDSLKFKKKLNILPRSSGTKRAANAESAVTLTTLPTPKTTKTPENTAKEKLSLPTQKEASLMFPFC